MQQTFCQFLKTAPLALLAVGLFLFPMKGFAATAYEVKNNYPADPETCVAGDVYDDVSDGFGISYECESPGKLCPRSCVALEFDEEDAYVALAIGERVAYEQSGLLKCEESNSGVLTLVFEEVSTEMLAESQVSCP